MSSITSQSPTATAFSPRRRALFGCGVSTLIVAIFFIVVGIPFLAGMQQPVDKTQVLLSLAGVPIYPDAQFDDVATRTSRASLIVAKGLEASRNATSAGFRTDADAKTKIIPFYDKAMDDFGFQKTRIDVRFGAMAEASYVNGETRVIVEVRPGEAGEAQMLLLLRFDGASKRLLRRPTNTVTPEDFKKLGIPIAPTKK